MSYVRTLLRPEQIEVLLLLIFFMHRAERQSQERRWCCYDNARCANALIRPFHPCILRRDANEYGPTHGQDKTRHGCTRGSEVKRRAPTNTCFVLQPRNYLIDFCLRLYWKTGFLKRSSKLSFNFQTR